MQITGNAVMGDRNISTELATLLMDLGQRPQERTRDQMFDVLGLDQEPYLLNKLGEADRMLRDFEIDVLPSLQDNPQAGTFLLRRKSAGDYSEGAVKDKLSRLESASQEFKSSYWCDLHRRLHQPEATAKQLRSEGVKHSALKSIAGFLTTGGGTLFIGVSDAGEVLGLLPDLSLLQKHRRNVDHLINNLRTDIACRFRNGDTVNDYVRIEVIDIAQAQILLLEVASRRSLSFLESPESDPQLYRRQGNRTTTVQIYDLEEFQAWRSKFILSEEP